MTVKYGTNYTLARITKPAEKVEMGQIAGKKRLLIDFYVADYAVQVGDEVLGLYIPKDSIVTGAKVKISKSLGATGIFSLGHKANDDDAEDPDAFVIAANGGGQAALHYAEAGTVGIFKKFEHETQVFLTCTEVTDGNVLDGIISFEIEYVNA